MTFSFIDAKKAEFPVARLCEVLAVSQSGKTWVASLVRFFLCYKDS